MRLVLADVLRELRAELVVQRLLLGERRLGEVYERRGVDVDVVKARRDLVLDELVHRG